jgi:hypothetical protein
LKRANRKEGFGCLDFYFLYNPKCSFEVWWWSWNIRYKCRWDYFPFQFYSIICLSIFIYLSA